MTVELPKDADGREIPLDTVVLFSRSGEAHNIVRWIYTTDLETWTESNMWRAIDENQSAIYPELMYLTPTDSWEKLLDDLDAAGNARHQETCAYFNRDKDVYCCTSCPCCKDDCVLIVMRDVASRIRKLSGED